LKDNTIMHKRTNRFVAFGVFLVSFVVYLLTLSPTVVFWDVGEYLAASRLLQVSHPPGAPLFLYWAHTVMMIPFAADIAVRAHALSALCCAIAIMLTYLIIVRLVEEIRGRSDALVDRVTAYSAGVIGAFSLAFNHSYWKVAVEAEAKSLSLFFVAIVVWLALRWKEVAREQGSERYIVMIAFVIGLSLGVRPLALLAIFPILMLVYFQLYTVTWRGFIKFSLVALGVFVVVYPGIVKIIPAMMGGTWGDGAAIYTYIPWIVLLVAAYFLYDSFKKKKKLLHIGLLSFLLIVLAYSTYVGVLVRSGAHPPMNENDPSNLSRLTSYIGRDQYGDWPMFFPRRWSQEPHQQGIYTNYSSDMDYLVRYQLYHMFFRYVAWNYVGPAGDEQDSGVSWSHTLGLPLLIGLLGLWYQFRKERKLAFVFLTLFVIMGPVLALYQNQQEPQPRERDYFYVGAYYVFAVWIGIGVLAAVTYVRQWLAKSSPSGAVTYATAGVLLLALPVNLVRLNWFTHDRTGNYVAWDYSYNILQTCEKDAILFTNGDNDTFPLWYLQDVEGVRRDVRIVNLSLVNTPWYIQQMKDPPYYKEAKPVPINLTDAEIAHIQPIQWRTQEMTLPVSQEAMKRYGVTDTATIRRGSISYTFRPTLDLGTIKAIRVQDIMVSDIITTNEWKRPIYFAVTVSPDCKIGFDDYLWFHGLAWRLEPRKITDQDRSLDPAILEANLFNEPQTFSREPLYGYRWRHVPDPKVYYDDNVSRLMVNYRAAFIRLALYHINVSHDGAKARAALDRMEALIPRAKIPMGWELTSDLATFYKKMNDRKKYDELMDEVEPVCVGMIASGDVNLNSYYNPYRVLLEIYDTQAKYDKSIALLNDLLRLYPNDQGLKQRIAEVELQKKQTAVK
jgi:hypothetical protein